MTLNLKKNRVRIQQEFFLPTCHRHTYIHISDGGMLIRPADRCADADGGVDADEGADADRCPDADGGAHTVGSEVEKEEKYAQRYPLVSYTNPTYIILISERDSDLTSYINFLHKTTLIFIHH